MNSEEYRFQAMSRPLKILMITHHRRNRTIGRSLLFGRYLVERGHRVTLLATAQTRRFGIVQTEQDGVQIIEAPDLLWGKLRAGWDLWSLINRIDYLSREKPDYDLVHCFETRPATIHPALYYVGKHSLPLFSDWNDWWGRGGIIDVLRPRWYRALLGGLETYYEEAFRPLCDGTTVISTGLLRRAEGLGVSPERLFYLPGGTIPEHHPVRTQAECRAHFGLPPDFPVLAFVSADSYLDMDLVMASLHIVAKKFPSVTLILTGHVFPSVLKLAEKYGVQAHVRPVGFVSPDDLTWWIGCADVCLLPFPNTAYNIGRWPNKVGHYMSLARPIVTNPYGDMKDLINHHQVGLEADATSEDFADKIMLLLQNQDLAQQLGRNGRRAAETTYDWRHVIAGLEDFYLRTLAMPINPRRHIKARAGNPA
jgi:glycosyltransferase involved in cell wall biosynthesis